MKLGLGTVQFGMNYGISNKYGYTPEDEVKKILKIAWENGVRLIDTAPSYGESEQVLGNSLNDYNFNIVTKTPVLKEKTIKSKELDCLKASVEGSLNKTKQNKLYGILIHNINDLYAENGSLLYKKVIKLKENGLTDNIGVSLYEPKEAEFILENYNFDIVQLPINVLDQRFIVSGMLEKLKEKNIEIHARSIFLQGLLLMQLSEIPSKFAHVKSLLKKYHKRLEDNNLSLLDGSIGYVKNITNIDRIIIGVNNSRQLVNNIKSYNKQIKIDYSEFACYDKNIIDPRMW